ncbi:MAG: Rap1a/Tai family immunity protein [Burkholderiales bacterium]
MRLFCVVASLVVAFPGNAFAQVDPNWSQREMERMQAQQERWDAQAERQRAEQERQAAQAERQRAQQEQQQRDQYDRQSRQYQALPSSPERTPTPATERLQPIHTGNDLYSACTPDVMGSTTAANLQCMLYIGDISFGRKVVEFRKVDGGNCFPQGVTLGQIEDIVFTYLRDTPGRRHINATNLTVEAIIQAFPACKVTAVR